MGSDLTLLPCPLCGSENVVLQPMRLTCNDPEHPLSEQAWVGCDDCKVGLSRWSDVVAATDWNRRPADTPAPEPVKEEGVMRCRDCGAPKNNHPFRHPFIAETLGRSLQPAEALARRFHDAYERLAPQFGYETRQETRAFDPTTANGRLMIATCAAISQPPAPVTEQGEECRLNEGHGGWLGCPTHGRQIAAAVRAIAAQPPAPSAAERRYNFMGCGDIGTTGQRIAPPATEPTCERCQYPAGHSNHYIHGALGHQFVEPPTPAELARAEAMRALGELLDLPLGCPLVVISNGWVGLSAAVIDHREARIRASKQETER